MCWRFCATGGARREIEDATNHFRRNTAAVVRHDDLRAIYLDADNRSDFRLLGAVLGVVDDFLLDDQRPVVHAVAGLVNYSDLWDPSILVERLDLRQ
jgi:hypothetical protein